MKKSIFILICILSTLSVFGNTNDKFIEEMKKSITILYSAQSLEECVSITARFERIAQAESDRWEPFYYAAYGYLKTSGRVEEPAKKDEYLNLALTWVEKGEAINAEEAELAVLKGYIYMMQLVIDPMNRGAEYSSKSITQFEKAKSIDPDNPRAWYMQGNMQLGTAQFMGATNEVGCQSLLTAKEKYGAYKNENPIAPDWGYESLLKAMEQCNK